mgnify:CR=1 FL=1
MGEKSEPAAKSSIAVLKERALDLIAGRPEGIYQSDLRRLLEIDSSKCSKLISRLQGSGLICREKVPASSTYLLKLSSSPSDPACSREPESRSEEMKETPADLRGSVSRIDADCRQTEGTVHDPIGKIEDAIDSRTDSSPNGGRPSSFEGRIAGYFDSQRSFGHRSHIDTYLTEIYLLYLTRAATS